MRVTNNIFFTFMVWMLPCQQGKNIFDSPAYIQWSSSERRTDGCCSHRRHRDRGRGDGWWVSLWQSLSQPVDREKILVTMVLYHPHVGAESKPPFILSFLDSIRFQNTTPCCHDSQYTGRRTFIRTDLLSFSLLMILTATVFLETQWVPSFTSPVQGIMCRYKKNHWVQRVAA